MLGISLYLFAFVIIAFLGRSLPQKKQVSFESIASFILVFVLFGFRDLPILNDTAHYYAHFQEILGTDWGSVFSIDPDDRFEYGYQIFEKLVAKIFRNPYSIIFISALIITVTNIYFIKEYTVHVALAVYVYLTQMILLLQFSAIRQALAICCFYIAFKQLDKGKLLRYFILILLASSFHSSAIILLFVPIILRLPFNKRNVFIFILSSSLIAIFMMEIIRFLGFGGSDYFERDLNRDSTAIGVLLKIAVATVLIIVSVIQLHRTKISRIDRSLLWLSLLEVLFSVLSLRMMAIGRFASYFAPFTSLLFIRTAFKNTNSINRYRLNNPFVFNTILIVLYIQFIIVLEFRPEWYHLIPYSFYNFGTTHINIDFGY